MKPETVTVEIPIAWVHRVNSPLAWVVGALTGVSVTFAPMYLFYAGAHGASWRQPLVLISGAMVYLVPLWYIALARPVMQQLQRRAAASAVV